MVTDLTHYLFSNSMLRYIEGYVQKVNPAKAPQVVGGLLDAEASDDFINNLILSVRSLIPVEQLCAEVRCLLVRADAYQHKKGLSPKYLGKDVWNVCIYYTEASRHQPDVS